MRLPIVSVILVMIASSPAGATPSPAQLNIARWGSTAVTLDDGRVLVLGEAWMSADARGEIFDPDTGTWTPTSDPGVRRWEPRATRLHDGRVLVVGNGDYRHASAQLYDPLSDSWSNTAPMILNRLAPAITLLSDGRALVTGGIAWDGRPNPSATHTTEIYDPSTDRWTLSHELSAARAYHTATRLSGDQVLLVGGATTAGGDGSTTTELFHWEQGSYPGPSLLLPRAWHQATLLPGGRVLVTGGCCVDPYLSAPTISPSVRTTVAGAEIFDPYLLQWIPSAMPELPAEHTAVMTDGLVVVMGGYRHAVIGGESELSGVMVFHPETDSWSTGKALRTPRHRHVATYLGNGSVLVAGGVNGREAMTDVEAWTCC